MRPPVGPAKPAFVARIPSDSNRPIGGLAHNHWRRRSRLRAQHRPMLVCGTAWACPSRLTNRPLFQLLSDTFHTGVWSEGCQHVPLGDSKQLYSPSTGLRSLEAGLLTMLSQVWPQVAHSSLTELLHSLDCFGPWSPASNQNVPAWLGALPEEIPLHTTANETERLRSLALQCLQQHGIELLSVRAAVVLESQFNQAVAQFGSKGRLLSTVTMHVVMQLLNEYEQLGVEVYCDRQGGRKKYACVLLKPCLTNGSTR